MTGAYVQKRLRPDADCWHLNVNSSVLSSDQNDSAIIFGNQRAASTSVAIGHRILSIPQNTRARRLTDSCERFWLSNLRRFAGLRGGTRRHHVWRIFTNGGSIRIKQPEVLRGKNHDYQTRSRGSQPQIAGRPEPLK